MMSSHVHCPFKPLEDNKKYASYVYLPSEPREDSEKYASHDTRICFTPYVKTADKNEIPDELASYRSLQLNNVLPYKWICKIISSTGRGDEHGTGFLLNIPGSCNCVVVTARHVIKGATIVDITFPGHDTISVNSYNFRYSVIPGEEHDYGVIILPDVKGPMEKCGFGFCATMLDRGLLDSTLIVAGYPGTQMYLWGSGGRTQSSDANIIRYILPTSGGQSGSPVYMWHRGWWTVVGIHTSSEQRVEYVLNRSIRLNVSVMKQIALWLPNYQYLDFSFQADTRFLHVKQKSLEFTPPPCTDGKSRFDLIPVLSYPEGSPVEYDLNQWVILLKTPEISDHTSLCIDPYTFGGMQSPFGNQLGGELYSSHLGICKHLNTSPILRRAPELVSLVKHDGNPDKRAWGVKAVRFPNLALRIMVKGWEDSTLMGATEGGDLLNSAEEMFNRLSVDLTETTSIKGGGG